MTCEDHDCLGYSPEQYIRCPSVKTGQVAFYQSFPCGAEKRSGIDSDLLWKKKGKVLLNIDGVSVAWIGIIKRNRSKSLSMVWPYHQCLYYESQMFNDEIASPTSFNLPSRHAGNTKI